MSTIIRFSTFGLFFLIFISGCRPTQVMGSGGGVRMGPVEISIQSGGRALPTFYYRGNYYVLGERGLNYAIWIKNRTRQRLEVLTSVDGRDVINGQIANSYTRRGYILNPWRYVNITGFRTSMRAVAAFRFSSVPNSYSARRGTWYRVGKIQVAVFKEKRPIAYIPRPIIQRTSRGLKKSKAPSAGGARRKSVQLNDSVKRGKAYHRYRRYWRPRPNNRPDLGTAYGYSRSAPAQYTTFKRASSYPSYTFTLNYNNCAGYRRSRIYTRWCPRYYRPYPIYQYKKKKGTFSPPP